MRRERTSSDAWNGDAGGGAGRERVRPDSRRHDLDEGQAPPPGTLHRPDLQRVERRERLTTRAGLVAFIGIVAAFVLFVGATLSGRLFPSPTARPTIAVPATVDRFVRVSATDAFVVGGTAVYTTRDGGATWTQGGLPVPEPLAALGSPPGGAGGASARADLIDVPYDISFVDGSHGWIAEAADSRGASAGQASAISIYATDDGGHSWRGVAAPNVRGTNIDMQFADTYHGWLEVLDASATRAFRTADGGASWDEVTPPRDPHVYAAPVYTSEVEGWAVEAERSQATGPVGGPLRVRHTVDGGTTWSTASLDLSAAPNGIVASIGTPFRRGGTLELAAALCIEGCATRHGGSAGASPSDSAPASAALSASAVPSAVPSIAGGPITTRCRIVTFASADGGNAWKVDAVRDAPPREAVAPPDCTVGTLSTVDRTPVLIEAWGSGTLDVSFDEGVSWRAYSVGGLPHPVVATSWASPDDVWVLTASDDGSMLLYGSRDGARSWRPLLGSGTLQAVP